MKSARTIEIKNPAGQLIAKAIVSPQGRRFGGEIDLSAAPAEIRSLFDRFEECVNQQQFTSADETEALIDALSLRAVFENGWGAEVADLQVFPKTGHVSFRIDPPMTINGAATGASPVRDTPADWIEKLTGSISDPEAFEEALKYGRELRYSDRPTGDAGERR